MTDRVRVCSAGTRFAAGLLTTAELSVAARRGDALVPFDRRMTLPAPVTRTGRRAWLAVTALGSRPVAYGLVAARCLLPERTGRSALDRYLPVLVLAGGDAARTVLCRAVDRPRPPAEERLAPCDGASFPSRHTALALMATGLATGAGPAVAGAVGAAVGLSRIALRVHWPTDVVGGWLFGHGWLAAAEMAGACRSRSGPAIQGPFG
ncbi:phosphatase PAP2 family protein [Streptomyces sp. NPDC047028]|uniref:phosphatase PAP2 family protein n=1 Tax=Streptomyces sp. NPDC047028 TaxID=3155793 RepID=UPI00340ABFDD